MYDFPPNAIFLPKFLFYDYLFQWIKCISMLTFQNGADEHDDKHANWVQKLSDANLFTALKANGRDVGGIVGKLVAYNVRSDLPSRRT